MKVQRNNGQTVTDVIPYDKGNETQGNMYNIPFGNSLPLRVEAGSKVILARSLFFVDFPVFTCKFGKISFL